MTARTAARLAALALAAGSLAACNTADRLSQIGKAPGFSQIENPQTALGYQPASMPMPAPRGGFSGANSLWQTGARSFFKDQRASEVGDIVTVDIRIQDRAQLTNTTERSREGEETLGIPNLLGFERNIGSALPRQFSPDTAIGTNSESTAKGEGSIQRNETINLKVAAIVTQVLPNGNLVIQGRQEVRVNYELRDLTIAGVVRPEDITSRNTISYEKIAEARISYGGRGQITDVQQPRYGQQVLDAILPF
ncbi:MAG TPA: flagellar basal body L-ring protein FlgH [Alphaproteobacteria bacterium]|nr:flagellar basal body L-ring protein FlgH [Alphaproteobacteria bacterium]